MICRLLLVTVLLPFIASQQDPIWDHQTTTYTADHQPVSVSDATITFTPFFSPDHSVDTLVDLINSAETSINIGAPGWDAWNDACTPGTGCQGCDPLTMRNDSFPIWAALLNAAHRNITVRVLTNDYDTSDCPGVISPLPFLVLNGIDVRYYATTTYIHCKRISVDQKKAAVSSVNFSKASFLANREAGVVIEGDDAQPFIELMDTVFDEDFAKALPVQVNQSYTGEQMDIITDPSYIVPIIPPIPVLKAGRYITPTPVPITGSVDATITVSPDFSDETLLADVSSAKTSVYIMEYQVTSDDLCNMIEQLYKSGVDVNLFVSYRVYDTTDCAAAIVCYNRLYNAGLKFTKTPEYYYVSHGKSWIVDGERMAWSTGNWSPSDYPTGTGVQTFPPYGNSGWRDTNRDWTVYINEPQVIDVFQTLYNNDIKDGYSYTPHYTIYCGDNATRADDPMFSTTKIRW
jgi:phosphatidylserine/phosphatidylglycerophosphate/cardiolipin synthase-like enzyme